MKRRILSMVCALLLLSALVIPAAAVEVVDLNQKGSLSITMTYKDKAVSGGKLTIYRVAEVCVDGLNHSFRYLPDFEDCQISLDSLSSALLAETLAGIVKDKKLTGITKTIDTKGQVTFTNLDLGLYLVIQSKAAPGYSAVAPFIVSVPNRSSGQYIYDVDATPKMDVEPKPTEPQPTDPPPGKLPQTGQLSWPAPVMLITGLLLIVGGCCLHTSRKKKTYES